ncbi:calcium homeostasis modulator protein 1-like [Carassius carassius]|uniref:calcium homeostasis modulator protein 1-like n=1 Tax=Carassius carassius TaxID=217509 RepID=UPI0028693F9C|nr:calcium homeostasis modulator protein 1-like [Carassius carassius]
MDKFRMMAQILQSNQESFMNGICGVMALASAQLYTSFEFNCPCIPEYNYSYGISMLVIPPIWFFLLGFVLNNNISMLAEEWKRPVGLRRKDPAVIRYMCVSISQRSLIAPAVWISVTLMDGKSFLCAYSMDLDMTEFGKNVSGHGLSQEQLLRTLAKIPCKHIYDGQHILSREAATRYICCISQAFGWLFLMIITIAAFLIRAIRPCFTQAAFLKTKYWSHYVDTERKMFDETCTEHAKTFAKICIKQYFEDVSGEIQSFHDHSCGDDSDDEDDKPHTEEDKLMGVRRQDTMNKVLWDWHTCKPPLSLRKYGDASTEQNGDCSMNANKNQDQNICDKTNLIEGQNGFKCGYVNPGLDIGQSNLDKGYENASFSIEQNGFMNIRSNASTRFNGLMNGGVSSPRNPQRKTWAVYYSKV